MIQQLIVCTLVLCVLCSFASCQFGNSFGCSYGGTPGIGANCGVVGGHYNNYAQNTQAYSNQVCATNYAPYASYNSYCQTPANWGTSYGNSYAYPWAGLGCGGYGYGLGCGGYGLGLGCGFTPYLGCGRIC